MKTEPVSTERTLARRVGAAAAVSAALLLATAMGRAESYTINLASPEGAKGRRARDSQASCWLPDGCKYVRGVIAAHPMIGGLATDGRFRQIAAEEGLGTMVFAGHGDIEAVDRVLEIWAERAGHPELRGAAILTGGLSASCLSARRPAYEAPERVFGVVHVAGGNLHEREPHLMTGVPFQAHNGQYEWCGPEGGLRGHLLNETQWYLMAQAILERRTRDPGVLMSLVVVPNADHGAWNRELAALFVKKAAQTRLPREKRDGSTPARCVAVEPQSGWLTDGALKYATIAPAPYDDYEGEKNRAFWHFDAELARAVHEYHRRGFGTPGLIDRVWPLGTRMDVDWGTRTPRNDAAVLRAWLAGKMERGPEDVVVRMMAAAMAQRVNLQTRNTERMIEDMGLEGLFRQGCVAVCGAHDAVLAPLRQAAAAAALPEVLEAALFRQYGLMSVWPPRYGHVVPFGPPVLPFDPELMQVAAVVRLPPGRSMGEELAERWPAFAALSPLSRLLLMDALARLNPYLNREGTYRARAATTRGGATAALDLLGSQVLDRLHELDPGLRPEPPAGLRSESVLVPLDATHVLAHRYHLRPERLLALPPASVLARLSDPERVDLRNAWIEDAALLEGLSAGAVDLAGCGIRDAAPLAGLQNLSRLRLAHNPVTDLSPLRGLALRHLDLTGVPVEDVSPLRGMPLESLALADTAVADLSPLRGMRLRELDLRRSPVADLSPLTGMPLLSLRLSIERRYEHIEDVLGIASLGAVGDVAPDEWMRQYRAYHAAGPERTSALLPLPLPAQRAGRPGPGDWPARLGPHGSGRADGGEEVWVEEMTLARQAWVSDARLPASLLRKGSAGKSLSAPIVGGHASPVVAGGRVYVGYYVPNGPVYDERNVAKAAEEGRLGREHWYTDADDVLLCVDAATGRTQWRRAFVEAGYNYNWHPHRPNVDMTPCVAGDRVYMLGSRARVYCVDAATGAPRWRSSIGFRTLEADYVAERSRARRRVAWTKEEFLYGVAAAGGVVGVLDFRSHYIRCRDIGLPGLIGLDGSTGVPLWTAQGAVAYNGAPLLGWAGGEGAGGPGFLIGKGREIVCLGAKDGRPVWRLPSGSARGFVAPGTRVICAGAESGEAECFDTASGRPSLERTVALPLSDKVPVAASARYLYAAYEWTEKEQRGTGDDAETVEVTYHGLARADLAGGAVDRRTPCPFPPEALYCCDGQVLAVGRDKLLVWHAGDDVPAGPPLDYRWAPETVPALAGGRLYLRTQERLVCLELRREATLLDAGEIEQCFGWLKRGPAERAAAAAVVLRNVGAADASAVLKGLRRALAGRTAGKAAVLDTLRVLVTRPRVDPGEREAAVHAVAALLETGELSQRLAACGALGAMGPAAKAALPALREAYIQTALQQALLQAARKIAQDENYDLTPEVGEIPADDELDLGIDFDL